MRAVALNHLDIWTRRGGPAFKLEFPHRLGADIAGVVDAVGPGATATVGAKIVLQPGLSCGRCAACLGGHDNLCRSYSILGEHAQGGYAEYIVVPEVNLAPYPERLDFAARGVVDPAVPDRVADGRPQGAGRARRHRARARRRLGHRRRRDPDREAVRRAGDRDRGQR